jgi:hypothetical protein
MTNPLESSIEASVIRWVRAQGGVIYKWGTGGQPDRVIGYKGKVYLIELKRPKGGRTSILQKAIHEEWAKAGVTVHTAKTLDEVKRILEGG